MQQAFSHLAYGVRRRGLRSCSRSFSTIVVEVVGFRWISLFLRWHSWFFVGFPIRMRTWSLRAGPDHKHVSWPTLFMGRRCLSNFAYRQTWELHVSRDANNSLCGTRTAHFFNTANESLLRGNIFSVWQFMYLSSIIFTLSKLFCNCFATVL